MLARASPIVFSFNARKSMIVRHLLLPFESAFLGTTHKSELYDGWMILFFNKSFACLLISRLQMGGNLYRLAFIGLLSVVIMYN